MAVLEDQVTRSNESSEAPRATTAANSFDSPGVVSLHSGVLALTEEGTDIHQQLQK